MLIMKTTVYFQTETKDNKHYNLKSVDWQNIFQGPQVQSNGCNPYNKKMIVFSALIKLDGRKKSFGTNDFLKGLEQTGLIKYDHENMFPEFTFNKPVKPLSVCYLLGGKSLKQAKNYIQQHQLNAATDELVKLAKNEYQNGLNL